MIRLLVAALLVSSCGAYGFWGGAGRTERDYESLRPAVIGPRTKAEVPVEKLTVRIWAEEDYQRLTLDWQVRLHKQIERVNEVLRAVLGIELEVVQVKTWPQESRLTSLAAAAFNLQTLDPGEGVDIVLGLISPLPVATSAIHELGRASLLGKHIVLRGTDSPEEAEQFARRFEKLSVEKRDQLYVERRRHKEDAILLHELGHLLGAIHVAGPTAIMNPFYTPKAAGFSPADVDIMKIALRERNQPHKEELIAYFEKTTFEGFMGKERLRMLALLTGDPLHLARASDADVSEPMNEGGAAPQVSVVDPVRDAAELMKLGKDKQAWSMLEPMLEERPDDPNVVNLSCNLSARLETATVAETLCRRALDLVPDDAAPALYLGFVLLEDDRDASEALAEADRRLTRLGDRAPREGWAFLARLHQRALSVTFATRAAAKAEGTEDAVAIPKWAAKIRADFGLKEGAIPPERESRYLLRRNALNDLTRKRRFAEAKKLAAELAAEFPDLPGPDAVLCYVLVSERAHAQALEHCRRAIAAEPESVQLRVLIGYAAFGARRPAEAIPHLEKALAVEPKQKDVWSLLAAAYRAAGKREDLADLRGKYRERFGEQLR